MTANTLQFDAEKAMRDLNRRLDGLRERGEAVMAKPTSQWSKPVQPQGEVERTGPRITLSWTSNDKRYIGLIDGTPARTIRPKTAKMLVWDANVATPKTLNLDSNAGQGKAAGRVFKKDNKIFADRVEHPGTKPQDFFDEAADELLAAADREIDAWFDGL